MRKITTFLCMFPFVLVLFSLFLAAGITARAEFRDYTSEDIMCIANMVYGEISAVCYDDAYSVDEQNEIMQRWAMVALNHIEHGIADSIPELMRSETGGGYYVWHPMYGTAEYMEKAVAENADIYERCRIATIAAMNGTATDMPDDVIFADLRPLGEVYARYSIDTGYYSSTVYLCYA